MISDSPSIWSKGPRSTAVASVEGLAYEFIASGTFRNIYL